MPKVPCLSIIDIFRDANVDITSIRGIEDLHKLPFVTKEQQKVLPPKQAVSSLYDFSQLEHVRTSGSTGKPLQVFITPSEDAWRKAIYMRANINCGQKPRDRWVVLTAPHHFGDTTRFQRALGIFSKVYFNF